MWGRRQGWRDVATATHARGPQGLLEAGGALPGASEGVRPCPTWMSGLGPPGLGGSKFLLF